MLHLRLVDLFWSQHISKKGQWLMFSSFDLANSGALGYIISSPFKVTHSNV
jgi:hypothetical protein